MSDKITKTFRRVIKTGEYETVEVISSIEREITDTDKMSYNLRIHELRDEATDQLVEDLNMIVDKLGVSEKRVKVTSPRSRPVGV